MVAQYKGRSKTRASIHLLTHHFPPAWKHAQVISILKPGKDPAQPTSYWPISLLNTIGKLLVLWHSITTPHSTSTTATEGDKGNLCWVWNLNCNVVRYYWYSGPWYHVIEYTGTCYLHLQIFYSEDGSNKFLKTFVPVYKAMLYHFHKIEIFTMIAVIF
jgi:hypothetical protein